MDTGKSSEERPPVQREMTPVFYTNAVQIASSIYGVVFSIGIRHPDDSTTRCCEVHMSPQHAKVLTRILAQHIREYESKIGPIPTPPSEAEGTLGKKGGTKAE